MIHLQNPYAKPTTRCRVQGDIPAEDYSHLICVFPGFGNMQAVVNTLVHGLVRDLKANGITHYNIENESTIRTILCQRRVVFGEPIAGPTSTKPTRLVTRGAGKAAGSSALSEDKQSHSLPKNRGGGKKEKQSVGKRDRGGKQS